MPPLAAACSGRCRTLHTPCLKHELNHISVRQVNKNNPPGSLQKRERAREPFPITVTAPRSAPRSERRQESGSGAARAREVRPGRRGPAPPGALRPPSRARASSRRRGTPPRREGGRGGPSACLPSPTNLSYKERGEPSTGGSSGRGGAGGGVQGVGRRRSSGRLSLGTGRAARSAWPRGAELRAPGRDLRGREDAAERLLHVGLQHRSRRGIQRLREGRGAGGQEAVPGPARAVQLHLPAARGRQLPAALRAQRRAARRAAWLRRLRAEAAAAGEHHGEQHPVAPEGGITFLSYEPGSRCLPSYVALGFIPSNIPNFTQHVLCARLLTCLSIQGSEKFTFQPSKEHFTAQSVIVLEFCRVCCYIHATWTTSNGRGGQRARLSALTWEQQLRVYH